MRSLVLDELQARDLDKLRERLNEILEASALPDVFWLSMPPDLLNPDQAEHQDTCGPHRMAVVLEEDSLRLEMLVRAQESLRCSCTAYPTRAQRDFMLNFLDRLIEDLELST
jgi:hypothetical protein